MIKQTQSQFTFVARAVRQPKLKQNRLQERPASTQPGARGQHHVELLMELRGKNLQQQRLAGPRPADDEPRAIAALDRAPEAPASVLDRASRKVPRDLRISGEHAL